MKFIFLLCTFFAFKVFASSKDAIRITGSASVYPVVSYIYENSNIEIKKFFKKNPIIESVGTGAGFDAYCKKQFDANSPDVVNASRQITEKEIENCKKNGIQNLQKITLGLDGIVLAYFYKDKTLSKINLTIEDLQKALSKYVVIKGEVVLNKASRWNEIREDLPNSSIIIYGPNSNSGTFDFFREVIQKQCSSLKEIQAYFKKLGKNIKDECNALRNDVYIQMPDQDVAISRKLTLHKGAIGILRFSFFENSGKFLPITINGIEPSEEVIVKGEYKLSRPFFVYYDSSYLEKVNGLKEFLIQVSKFSYRDLIKDENEYINQQSEGIVIQYKNNKAECISNKKIIGFEFNCGKNG
jgi:phosphate transport system substrate-binding protein